jgi:hypothetical protein
VHLVAIGALSVTSHATQHLVAFGSNRTSIWLILDALLFHRQVRRALGHDRGDRALKRVPIGAIRAALRKHTNGLRTPSRGHRERLNAPKTVLKTQAQAAAA